MGKSTQFSLYIATIFWAILLGGVVYSHIVYFPPYLSHLPESNKLITGDYGLHDEHFWMTIHPCTILSTIVALVLNWRHLARRKLILISAFIYVLAIIATATYFLPGLFAFAHAGDSTVTPAEWAQRGQTWQYLSWVRGTFVGVGFVMLLVALAKK